MTKNPPVLRRESAAGPDRVGPVILKELEDGLAPVLAHVFRRSLAEGNCQEDWKKANVTPIFKKGSKSDPATIDQFCSHQWHAK